MSTMKLFRYLHMILNLVLNIKMNIFCAKYFMFDTAFMYISLRMILFFMHGKKRERVYRMNSKCSVVVVEWLRHSL